MKFKAPAVNSDSASDEWQTALRSDAISTDAVMCIGVSVGHIADQGWGNTKGRVAVALYQPDGTFVARCDLFGLVREDLKSSSASRTVDSNEEVVSLARRDYYYQLEYVVGGGGGHQLSVRDWVCTVFLFAEAHDEEGEGDEDNGEDEEEDKEEGSVAAGQEEEEEEEEEEEGEEEGSAANDEEGD